MERLPRELIYRILDVNFNRAAEGIRVCEEVTRFILNNRRLTAQFRDIRHQIAKTTGRLTREELIKKRNSKQDVGRTLLRGELKRGNYQDIFFANIQRVKESIRVLEEFHKLVDIKTSVRLKRIRYRVYEIEKKAAGKLPALFNIRQKVISSK